MDKNLLDTIPLIVGVTGHRDLYQEDIPDIKDKLRKFFDKILKDYKNTKVVLVTALAEGADSLVAEVALEYNIELFAVLPMAQEKYKKEFADINHIEKFNALLAGAKYEYIIPGEEDSHIQYGKLAMFLVQYCNIVISLWDGIDNKKLGGTSYVINLINNGVPLDDCISVELSKTHLPEWNYTENYNINVRRKYEDNKIEIRDTERKGFGNKDLYGKGYFSEIDKINKEIKTNFPKIHQIIQWEHNNIENTNDTNDCDGNMKKIYACFSAQSIFYNKRIHKLQNLIFLLSFICIVFINLYSSTTGSLSKVSIYIYSIAFILGFLFYIYIKKLKLQDKYIDYRTLAEGLRIQHFLRKIDKENYINDCYLSKTYDSLNLIRIVFNNLNLFQLVNKNTDKCSINTYEDLYNNWIADQRDYFQRKSIYNRKVSKQFNVAIYLLILSGLGITFFSSVVHFLSNELNIDVMKYLNFSTINFLICFLPAFAGMLSAYSFVKAYGEQSKRYEKLYNVYNNACKSIESAIKSYGTSYRTIAEDTILMLAREAVDENMDWAIIHKDRPIKFI